MTIRDKLIHWLGGCTLEELLDSVAREREYCRWRVAAEVCHQKALWALTEEERQREAAERDR